ncbi:MAG: hypothetical protein QG553_669 [Patescibacteria group bacterium]|nr:hypothetical protein [Patescibacteria group bacterium]
MAHKVFELDNIGTVYVYKRRGAKNMRLSVNSDGKIRVSMPTWLPYQAGLTFAQQKRDWLATQSQREVFKNDQRIGKYHTLRLISKSEILNTKTRLLDTEAIVYYGAAATESQIQTAAHDVAKRAAKAEAEQLLPQRLKTLANQYDFSYNALSVRHLKSRWGSCSSKHDITLNYYLMQLPWELIDYVLVHELAHTRHLNHSSAFWATVEACLLDYKKRRQQLKHFQPSLLPVKSA